MSDPTKKEEWPIHELLTFNLRRLTAQSFTPLTVIANRAGIDRSELFGVLAGEREADVDWLFRLAEGVGVRAAELLREPKDLDQNDGDDGDDDDLEWRGTC